MPTEHHTPLKDFCQHHNIDINLVIDLQNFGLVEIVVEDNTDYLSEESVASVEKIIRLHHELNINLEGIDVILQLLERIQLLQKEVVSLQNKNTFLTHGRR